MSLKKAFEKLYEDVKPPEDLERKVLLRLRERRARFWRRVALAEAAVVLVALALFLYSSFEPTNYETMGEKKELKVLFAKDVTLSELSAELERFNLLIEGPYGRYYILRGAPSNVDKFLKERENLVRQVL